MASNERLPAGTTLRSASDISTPWGSARIALLRFHRGVNLALITTWFVAAHRRHFAENAVENSPQQ
jgi:hypothetical protein